MESIGHQAGLAGDRRRLIIVLAATTLFFVAELVGGYLANSLALVSDAVHVLTDIAALCLSLFTLWISSRPAHGAKTFGYLRAEILGALFNGLFLWVLVIFVWFEAVERIRHPPAINAPTMIVIATIGIGINSFAAWMTADSRGQDGRAGMAMRAVFIHAAADLAGALGVLTAGALVWFTGWREADPIVSIMIGGLIVYGSWELVRDGVDILMESVPAHIDLDQLHRDLLAVKHTEEVHDLHVWCLTSRQFALSAHAVISPNADHDSVLGEIAAMLEHKFNIRHVTVQLERDNRREQEPEHF